MGIFGDIYDTAKGAVNWGQQALAGGTVDAPVAPLYDWAQSDADRANQAQAREQQSALGGMLMAQAQGNGPSVAQNQLRQAQAQNMAQMNAQAASAGGGAMNRMQAQNAAINAGATAGQQAAGQAATLRAQEQLGAMGQMGQLYGQQRGQDQGAQALSQNRQLGVGSQAVDTHAQQVQAQTANQTANREATQGILKAGIGLAGGAMMASDVRLKKDISHARHEEMSALLDHLIPHEFRYREENDDAPIRIGIMAQDIEKAPGGKALVGRDAEGMRHIQGGPALGAVLAALGDIHERIMELEGGRRHGRR